MAESEEELKSLLMKVKEESEKVGLKLNFQCREPAWGIPPVAKVMRKGACQNAKAGSGLRGPPGFSWASTPKTRVCLLYYIMPFNYSSNINRGLSPHHLFREKVNLELLECFNPKPLWWLSGLPDMFIRTLTAVHVIVYSLPTVRGIGSLKHPRNIGASEESKSLE